MNLLEDMRMGSMSVLLEDIAREDFHQVESILQAVAAANPKRKHFFMNNMLENIFHAT